MVIKSTRSAAGTVQSLERAFDLLELMADAGGSQGLSQLASASGLPLPTIHRLMRTLVNRGYVRQEPSRRYTLGPRLIRLGDTASRLLGTWAQPYLTELRDITGETANLAMLEGDEIVYVSQMPSFHSMRMFTEPGRRVLAHCTAVGKVLLAELPDSQVRAIVGRTGMPALTPATITDPKTLLAHLEVIREQGYATDEGEQEVGVRCIAVAVPDAPAPTAVSVSGPQGRITEESMARAVPHLKRVVKEIAAALKTTEASTA